MSVLLHLASSEVYFLVLPGYWFFPLPTIWIDFIPVFSSLLSPFFPSCPPLLSHSFSLFYLPITFFPSFLLFSPFIFSSFSLKSRHFPPVITGLFYSPTRFSVFPVQAILQGKKDLWERCWHIKGYIKWIVKDKTRTVMLFGKPFDYIDFFILQKS